MQKTKLSINGFTLVEMLIVTAVLTIIIGGGLGIYVMSNRSWRKSGVQINLQQKARTVMEKMIYGRAENTAIGTIRNGIIGAEQIQILDADDDPVNPPSPGDRIDFQLQDAVSRNRSFYLDSGRIWYKHGVASASAITPDPATTGIQVSNLQFSSDSNLVFVVISLDMEQTIGGVNSSGGDTTVKVHLQSAAKKRN